MVFAILDTTILLTAQSLHSYAYDDGRCGFDFLYR